MKTASKTVKSVELNCPYCSEVILAPNYSAFWTIEDVQLTGDRVVCFSCSNTVRLPKI